MISTKITKALANIVFGMLFCFLISCAEPPSKTEPPDISTDLEIETPPFDDTFVVPEMPDLFGYAATDEPAEPFRFEYQFQTDQQAFTIKANQLNERVICDITFRDGTSAPIELYVNQYRVLVTDLINTASETPSESNASQPDTIVVQSVAKTHRLEKTTIPLPANFVEWVAKHLKNDGDRERFRSELGNHTE